MNKGWLILLLILAVLLVIIIIQNRGPVRTHFLFITVEMPQILLLLITACFGFAIGILVSLLAGHKKGQEGKAKPKESVSS